MQSRTKSRLLSCIILLFLFSAALFSTGCARNMSCRGYAAVNFLGTSTDLRKLAHRMTDDLILSARPMLVPRNPNLPVLVTTFVDNNDLSRTNAFGRTLQTAMSSRFVQQDYSVKEILLGDTYFIEPREGLTVLTRDISRLALGANTQAVVVGTWNRTGRTLYINTRLVNPGTGAIISSKDYRICMDDEIFELFNLEAKDAPYANRDEIRKPSRGILNTIFPFLNI